MEMEKQMVDYCLENHTTNQSKVSHNWLVQVLQDIQPDTVSDIHRVQ